MTLHPPFRTALLDACHSRLLLPLMVMLLQVMAMVQAGITPPNVRVSPQQTHIYTYTYTVWWW